MGLLETIFGKDKHGAVADLERIDYVHGPRRQTSPSGAPYHPVNPDTLTTESFDLRKGKGGTWEFVRAVSPLKGGAPAYEVLSCRGSLAEAHGDLQAFVKQETRLSISMLWRMANDGAFYQPNGQRTTGVVSLPAVTRALNARTPG